MHLSLTCGRILPAVCAILLVGGTLVSRPARAEDGVFTYGFRGLGVGIPVGMGAGYLLTRDSSWGTEDWKDVGLGAAVGAAAGAVGGLAVGIYDLQDGRMGMGGIVLRDTWYGTLLGSTVGLIVGGAFLIDSGDSEDLLVGAAWGALIGAPVGVGVGFIEASARDELGSNEPQPAPPGGTRFYIQPYRAVGPRGQASLAWLPGLTGSF